MNAKKIFSLLIFVCMLSPSVFSYLPANAFSSVAAASTIDHSAPSEQSSGTPLPPGTVTYKNTWNNTPSLVQIANGSRSDVTQINTTTDHVYNSTAGYYIFPKLTPWVMQYNYTKDNQSVSFSTFAVNQSSAFLLPVSSIVAVNPLYYNVNTTLENLLFETVGYLDQNYSFTRLPPKITVHYTQAISGPFDIFWLVSGYSYVAPNATSSAIVDSSPLVTLGFHKSVVMSPTPVISSNYVTLNFTDYGSAEILSGSVSFDAVSYSGTMVIFEQNNATIDPWIVQGSYGGSSSTSVSVSFSGSVTSGDLLIAAITCQSTGQGDSISVSDNRSDSWSIAEQAKGSSVGREADIWYTTARTSASDSVTASGQYLYITLILYEVSGISNVAYVGSTGGASGGPRETTLSVSSFKPNSASFVISSFVTSGGTPTYTSGYTAYPSSWISVSGYHSGSEYNTSSTMAATTTSIGLGTAGDGYWGIASAAFYSLNNAGASSSPWSKPGLSPFESYFASESEYVSPGNGLLGIEQTDYSLAGRGLSLALTRVYSTPYAFTSSAPYGYDNYSLSNLGLGWQLNFPWMGSNYVHLSDGQVYQYRWSGNTFLNNAGTPFKLVNNSGSSYELYLSSGVDYHFNSVKHLVSITDPTGNNTISFGYGSSNNYISNITDSAGRTITFSYNGNNQLSTVSTGEGNFVYGYSDGNLISVTDPAGLVTKYYYTTGYNSWLVSSIAYPTGAYTNYTYAGASLGVGVNTYYVTLQNIYVAHNDLSRTSSYSYNITNGQVQYCNSSVSNGFGKQGYINYVFSTPGKSTEVEKNAANSTLLSYESDYDALGRVNGSKILSPTNGVLVYSTTRYDNWSNVIYTKSETGQQTWLSYANTNTSGSFEVSGFNNGFYSNNTISSNIHDLLVGQASFQNVVNGSTQVETFYNYNSAGELVHQKQYYNSGWLVSTSEYDQYGNKITFTDPLGRTTYYQYSGTYNHAYPTQSSIMVSGQNISATFTYNFNTGTKASATDPNGQTTSYTYDSIGRVKTITYPRVNNVLAYIMYTYNDPGNYVTITDPNGKNVTDHFDGLDRLSSLVTYNGSAVYSMRNYTHNYLNLVASNTTATGNEYQYSYDFMGFLTKVTNPDSTTVTYSYNYSNNTETTHDENGHETQYAYDWSHNLIWVRQWNSSSTYYKTNYSYDLTGNLLSTTDAKNQVTTYSYDGLDRLVTTVYPDGTNQTNAFDSVGNIISTKDPAGNVINYAFDSLNRLLNVTYPDHTFVNYTYDGDGNKLTQIYGSASRNYFQYDARDRLANETNIIEGNTFTTLYTYDEASNILSMIYPGGYNLTYTYDPMERVSNAGADLANFTYTLDNKISAIDYGNGVKTTYSYNSRDEPTSITSMNGTVKLMSLNYTYDGVGNVHTLNNENYSYNYLNQITSGNGTWGSITYSYDAAGNMLKMAKGDTATSYSYSTYNRLSSAGNINFTYNANGDLTKMVNGSSTYKYNYDYENRLTSVVLNGNTVENDSYDGGQNADYQTIGSAKTYIVYEGLNMIYSKTHQGLQNSITDDIYANGLHVAKILGSSTYYYQLDALGSTRLVTTSTASNHFSSNYEPFGLNYAKSGSETFMYTGKPQDAPDGLYYYGARIYEVVIGRFLTEDTYKGSLSDPLSQNRYIYAEDNPEKYVDPTGHFVNTSLRYDEIDYSSFSPGTSFNTEITYTDTILNIPMTVTYSTPPSSTVTTTTTTSTTSSSTTSTHEVTVPTSSQTVTITPMSPFQRADYYSTLAYDYPWLYYGPAGPGDTPPQIDNCAASYVVGETLGDVCGIFAGLGSSLGVTFFGGDPGAAPQVYDTSFTSVSNGFDIWWENTFHNNACG
ncbi:MAG: RHS repeat-associated core domain-containing protein [Nitrososphaerales archaeon]